MNKSTPRDLTQRLGLVVPQKWIPFSKDNINGPTVVEYRVPIFSNSKFYLMYFGHHKGKYIRVAWSFSPTGPFKRVPLARPLLIWNVFGERKGHVASPEVQKFGSKTYLFSHSPSRYFEPGKQITYMSRLWLGIFCSRAKPIALPPYARFFSFNGSVHAITNGADVIKFDPDSLEVSSISVDKSPLLVPDLMDSVKRVRHAQIVESMGLALCFFTRVGDAPERILVSKLESKSSDGAKFSVPIELLRPTEDYEGTGQKIEPSKNGISRQSENALRDPFVAKFGNQHFLYYSTEGEKGIACAKLEMEKLCAALNS